MSDKEKPKVVDVRVKEYDGFINTHKATVTLDNGKAGTGYGQSEKGAIEDASDKAKKNGCFLTTACVEDAGLPDTCRELAMLRQFRDTYLARLPHGASMIAEYYDEAPRIVERIERSPQRAAVLGNVWADVRRAVSLIERGDNELALVLYREMFTRLKIQFSEQ